MKIAMVSSEAAPYAKSGGLGDVMEALPKELARMPGNEVCLFLPYYKKIKENPDFPTELVAQFETNLGWRQQYVGVRRLQKEQAVTVYFIDNDYYFGHRGGSLYGAMDDGERFGYFSKAVLDAMNAIDFRPQVIQCNDWQTAALPVYLKSNYQTVFPGCKSVFTIHNIEYQGWADANFFDDVLGMPEQYRHLLTMDGSINLMKGAIECCDAITTVSETYAHELLYPYYAHGLDGVLSGLTWKLSGITNGIDMDRFDPATDSSLPCNYDQNTFKEGKAACKAALQKELGLPLRPDVPLMGMVTRLAGHKGIDLLCYSANRMLREDVQLVVVGTGEGQYEDFLRDLSYHHPDKVSAQICFNLRLANLVYAASDIYLMPSKSEPCGLSQMNAMRYGTVPVVNATGGLKDTVPPVNVAADAGLGVTFQSYNGDDFCGAVLRCLELYSNPAIWERIVNRDMATDFSWTVPAGKYMDLFCKVVGC